MYMVREQSRAASKSDNNEDLVDRKEAKEWRERIRVVDKATKQATSESTGG